MEAFEAVPIIVDRAKNLGLRADRMCLAQAMDLAKEANGRSGVSASPLVVSWDGESYHFLVDLGSYIPSTGALI